MGRDLESLSDNEKKFLKSIIGEGKKTDTEIADETGLSVSTANRIRHSFEEQDIIKEYIPVINLDGVSLSIYALVEINSGAKESLDKVEDGKVVFSGSTNEAEKTYNLLIGYRNYQDYTESIESMREKLPENSIRELKVFNEPDSKNFVLRGRSKI